VDRLDDLPIRHLNFIKNPQHPDLPNDFNLEVYVEAFNILLGRKTSQDAQIQQAGSFSFFDKRTYGQLRRNIGHGLEASIEFTRSVRVLLGQLLVFVNSTASAFYCSSRPENLHIYQSHQVPTTVNHLIKTWSDDNRQKEYYDRILLEPFINGVRVQAFTWHEACLYHVWACTMGQRSWRAANFCECGIRGAREG
jgi:hypothetical protein